MAFHTSLCNAWQANAFRVSFWWPYSGVAYTTATRQGHTYSKCDVAHTDSPTQHTKCIIHTQSKLYFAEECLIVWYIAPQPAPTGSLPAPARFALLFSLLFKSRVCVSVCVCLCVCPSLFLSLCLCECALCVCVRLCAANAMKVNAWTCAPATASDLESAQRKNVRT